MTPTVIIAAVRRHVRQSLAPCGTAAFLAIREVRPARLRARFVQKVEGPPRVRDRGRSHLRRRAASLPDKEYCEIWQSKARTRAARRSDCLAWCPPCIVPERAQWGVRNRHRAMHQTATSDMRNLEDLPQIPNHHHHRRFARL